MFKKALACFMALCFCLGLLGPKAEAAEKLILYTSMKESLIGAINEKFKEKRPDIAIDCQIAGAGKLMAKIATERQSGKIIADILWTSEVPDFYNMKKEGLLEKYIPTNISEVIQPFADYDGYFTAARLATMGVTYNTGLIKEAPARWDDIFGEQYKGAFGVANPALSGTAYMAVSMLVKQFGWEFIEKMAANKARIGRNAAQVVDEAASGELAACIGVDYITLNKMKKGAKLGFAFPPQIILSPSPAAILKDAPNLAAAKAFVDFLLSKEAQEIVAQEGTLPVRNDVKLDPALPVESPEAAMKRAIKIDYIKMMSQKAETIKKFTEIMQAKK